jgi:hypothetical protein
MFAGPWTAWPGQLDVGFSGSTHKMASNTRKHFSVIVTITAFMILHVVLYGRET